MLTTLKHILQTEIKRYGYLQKVRPVQFYTGLAVRLIFLLLAVQSSFIFAPLLREIPLSLLLLTLYLLDVIFKIILLRLRFTALDFFRLYLSRQTVAAYILLKTLFNYGLLLLPALAVGFMSAEWLFLLILFALLNNLFISGFKHFSRWFLAGIPAVIYILYALTVKSVLPEKLLVPVLIVLVISTGTIFYVTVKNGIGNARWAVRSKIFWRRQISRLNTLMGHELKLNFRNKIPRSGLLVAPFAPIMVFLLLVFGEEQGPMYTFMLLLLGTAFPPLVLWGITPFREVASLPFFMCNARLEPYLLTKFRLFYLAGAVYGIPFIVLLYFLEPSLWMMALAAWFVTMGIMGKIVFAANTPETTRADLNGRLTFNYEGLSKINTLSTTIAGIAIIGLFEGLRLTFGMNISLLILSAAGAVTWILNRVFIRYLLRKFYYIKYQLLSR